MASVNCECVSLLFAEGLGSRAIRLLNQQHVLDGFAVVADTEAEGMIASLEGDFT